MKYKLAYLCFGLSSLFRGLGKYIRSGPTIVCDPLTLPGWFVLDNCIIKQTPYVERSMKGFQWETWGMPDEWIKDMNKLKGRVKPGE